MTTSQEANTPASARMEFDLTTVLESDRQDLLEIFTLPGTGDFSDDESVESFDSVQNAMSKLRLTTTASKNATLPTVVAPTVAPQFRVNNPAA